MTNRIIFTECIYASTLDQIQRDNPGMPVTEILHVAEQMAREQGIRHPGIIMPSGDEWAHLGPTVRAMEDAITATLEWMEEAEKETGRPMGEGLGYKARMRKNAIVAKLAMALK